MLIAILQLSNLLGCPEPIPTVDLSLVKTIAFDLTNLQILNAKIKFFKILEFGGSNWVELIHENFKTKPAVLDCINISPSEISRAKKEANKLDLR